MSNLLLSVAIARAATVDEFGGFALLFAAYLVLLALSRAIVGLPLLLQPVGSEMGERGGEAFATAILLGLLGGSAYAVTAMFLDVSRNMALLFAVGMPVLLLQDAVRYAAFAQRRSQIAVVSDGLWLAVQTIGFVAFLSAPDPRVPLLVWIGGAATGCAALFLSFGRRPFRGGTRAVAWVRTDIKRRVYLAAEAVSNVGLGQLAYFALAAAASLTVVAGVRAGTTFLGAASTVLAGLSPAITAEVARARGNPRRQRLLLAIFVGVGIVAPVLVALVGLLLKDSWGAALLGATWTSARPTLVPLAIASACFTPITALVISLTVQGLNDAAFRVRLIGLAPVPLLMLLPIAHDSPAAAAFVWAGATALGLLLSATYLRRVRRERSHAVPDVVL